MTLEQYLTSNCERQVIDHAIRAEIGKDGNPRFYIHPSGVSGDTLDFVVTKNQLHPVYVWDGFQELANANPMTPELRAKLDAARSSPTAGGGSGGAQRRQRMNQEASNVESAPAVAVQRMVSRLVDKFLAWPLPESVCSDPCACERGYPHRSGTTLLTATEAEQMIRHLIGPALSKDATTEEEGESFMQGFYEGMEHEKSANDRISDPAKRRMD